jgi:hypothetical protein
MSKLAVIRLFAAVALLSAATSMVLATGFPSPATASTHAAATTEALGEAPVIPTGSIELGPMAASTPLSLDIVLAPRDPAALDTFLQQLYDPASPARSRARTRSSR